MFTWEEAGLLRQMLLVVAWLVVAAAVVALSLLAWYLIY
jgi:hypothetical protein